RTRVHRTDCHLSLRDPLLMMFGRLLGGLFFARTSLVDASQGPPRTGIMRLGPGPRRAAEGATRDGRCRCFVRRRARHDNTRRRLGAEPQLKRYSSGLFVLCLLPLPAWAAGSAEIPSLVLDISICFIAAGALAVVFARLRIPEIAAFLVAGALVGPFGAAVVSDPHNIDTIAQLGLILLLFLVGLEIDLRKRS